MSRKAENSKPAVEILGATWTMFPDVERRDSEPVSETQRLMRADPLLAWRAAAAMIADATGHPVKVSFSILTGRAEKRAYQQHPEMLPSIAIQARPRAEG